MILGLGLASNFREKVLTDVIWANLVNSFPSCHAQRILDPPDHQTWKMGRCMIDTTCNKAECASQLFLEAHNFPRGLISPTPPTLTYCNVKIANAMAIAMAVTPTAAPLQHPPTFATPLELELAVAPPDEGVACADALAVVFA